MWWIMQTPEYQRYALDQLIKQEQRRQVEEQRRARKAWEEQQELLRKQAEALRKQAEAPSRRRGRTSQHDRNRDFADAVDAWLDVHGGSRKSAFDAVFARDPELRSAFAQTKSVAALNAAYRDGKNLKKQSE
jgi:hypothetical protein